MPEPDDNKHVVSRYYNELLNEGRLDIIDDLFTAEFLADEEPVAGMLKGRGAVERSVAAYREGFSDFHEDIEHMVAEGDLVSTSFRFRGTHDGPFLRVPPTGRTVSMVGMEIFRVVDGRIATVWYAEPLHELLEQMGWIEPVDPGY